MYSYCVMPFRHLRRLPTLAQSMTAWGLLISANELYDEVNKMVVGGSTGYCFYTAIGKTWQCVWTKTLVDGQISVKGLFLGAKDSVLAVTGVPENMPPAVVR